MDDNTRTVIGYICLAFCFLGWVGIFWTLNLSDAKLNIKIEMDNNTRKAMESINYSEIYKTQRICYSEKCYLDLENNTIGGCSMYKVDCYIFEDKFGLEKEK